MTLHETSERRSVGGGSRVQRWFLGILVALAVAWFLRSTASFSFPVACALLIALAVWPICARVRTAVPDKFQWVGTLATMLVVIGFLALFLTGLGLAAKQLIALATNVGPQLQQKLENTVLSGLIGPGQQAGGGLQQFGSQALTALSTAWTVIAGVLLILFLVLLMLAESGTWKAKIAGMSDGRRNWAAMGSTVGQRFRVFFLTRLLLGSITAALYVAWLALFGIDYLLLWGLLAVLLNFIPTIGSLIAGVLPVLFAIIQKDPATAAAVAAGLFVIEQVMGNYVDPKLMGRQLSISPLVVLVSLLFWAWIWGIAGAFLAVPVTALIVIVFAHVEPLKPIALFLSDERNLADLEAHSGRG